VADVTTLISAAALVIVKIIVGAWSTLSVWACGRHLLFDNNGPRPKVESRSTKSSDVKAVGRMIRWKLPPWIIPASPQRLLISISMFFIAIRALISPLLTGAIN